MGRLFFACVSALGIGLSFAANAAERGWNDKVSGREFLMLDGTVSFVDAERECLKRGMVVSDLRFLTDDERKGFLKADAFAALEWQTQFAGTRQEVALGRLWQSSGLSSMSPDYAFTTLVLMRKGAELNVTQEFKNWKNDRANAVCMTVPAFWFYCNAELKCGQDGAPSNFAWRYKFHDYGATQNEAIRRIVERTQEPQWAVSTDKCVLKTESAHCLRFHPKF